VLFLHKINLFLQYESMRLCLKCQFHLLPFSLFTFPPLPLPGCLLYGRERQEQRLLCERIRKHTGRENVIHWQRMLECWVNILPNDVSLQRACHDWGDRYRYKVTWLTGLLSWYHPFRNWLVFGCSRQTTVGEARTRIQVRTVCYLHQLLADSLFVN